MGASVRNPYEVLGVSRHATPEEVKAAFRRLAAQHHPDRNPDDADAQERFKELNQAYQVVGDPEKRAAFDRWGTSAFGPGAAGPPGGGFVDLTSIDGIFGDILGAMGVKAADRGTVRRSIKLSFVEAALGCEKKVTYPRVAPCAHCDGTGAERGSATHVCPTCKGRGRTRTQHGVFPLPVDRFCSRCHGTGRITATPCPKCRGRGLAEQSHEESVVVPGGVAAGDVVKVPGAGSRLRRERDPGALEVLVEVEAHPLFRRVGDDVVCTVPISFSQAALGTDLEVPTLDGPLRVKVPPGTQSGNTLRLRGKGVVRRGRAGRGDHLVEVEVEVPVKLSERARALIAELADELGDDVMPQRKSFLERVRSWFK